MCKKDCCKDKKSGINFELKIDVTKIVKYLCITAMVVSVVTVLLSLGREIFAIEEND